LYFLVGSSAEPKNFFEKRQKMTILEKIEHSTPYEVHLFKEGIFWVAYEQSAFAICQLKPYKPTKKNIKAVGQAVVTVGFPENALAGILLSFQNTEKQDNMIIMQSETPFEQDVFDAWKNGIEMYVAGALRAMPLQTSVETSEKGLLQKIRSFDVSNASPIECMLFINELKQITN
jgi:hypothetical protein